MIQDLAAQEPGISECDSISAEPVALQFKNASPGGYWGAAAVRTLNERYSRLRQDLVYEARRKNDAKLAPRVRDRFFAASQVPILRTNSTSG